MRLYEISNEYTRLIEDEELSNEELCRKLEAIDNQFDEKIDNVACLMKSLKIDIEGIDNEIKSLQSRKKALQNKLDWFKSYVLENMEYVGKKKVSTPRNVISIRNAQTSVKIIDEGRVFKEQDGQFKRIKIIEEIDKVALKIALEEASVTGEVIEGAELIQNRYITIK